MKIEGPTVEINLDKKCVECGKGGATQNGLCLKCICRSIKGEPMKSELGKRHQAHIQAKLNSAKRTIAGR